MSVGQTSPNSATLLPRTQRRLASINAAAEYAGVCTKTIRRRISDGTISGYRLGTRTLRVDLNELDAALRPIPTASGTHATGVAGGGLNGAA